MLAKKAEQVKEQKLKKELEQRRRSHSRSGSSFRNELQSRLPRTATGPSTSGKATTVQPSSSSSFIDPTSSGVQARPLQKPQPGGARPTSSQGRKPITQKNFQTQRNSDKTQKKTIEKVPSKGELGHADPQLSGRSGAATAGQGTPKLNSFVDVDIDMFN